MHCLCLALNLAGAAPVYRRIAARDPRHSVGLHHLGLAEAALGHLRKPRA
jgi:hypothetical protein